MTLRTLMAEMKRGEHEDSWDSLPSFGPTPPCDLVGIWSWNETELLVGECAAELRIELMSEWFGDEYVSTGDREFFQDQDAVEQRLKTLKGWPKAEAVLVEAYSPMQGCYVEEGGYEIAVGDMWLRKDGFVR